jgi:CheY-like chemotaxis protein
VRTRTVRGTGLGLSICRSICEAHGGRVWAEPCEEGARFVMVLPFEPAEDVLRQEQPERAPVPAGTTTRTVLIVEDAPEVAYVLKAHLMDRPFKVHLAHSAEEALSLARRHRPDVLLLDVKLPDVDGIRLLEILKHDPVTRHAPVIVLSGSDERYRSMRHGASAFLQKPVAVDALLAAGDAALKGTAGSQQGSVLVVDDDE